MRSNVVSILMSVYINETGRNLETCLKSLLDQSVLPDEVVVVEDGPISSELEEVILKFTKQLNIVSVKIPSNVGLAAALNEGLKHCKNELIIRMDSDDIALPDRISAQLEFISNNPKVSVASGIIEEWDENFTKLIMRRVLPFKHEEIVEFAKKRSPISHPACIFKKKDVIICGGYPNVYPEDYILWIKMIQEGFYFANQDVVLLKMRTGKGFIARRGMKFLIGEVKIYRYMFNTGFISFFEYVIAVCFRSILRLSPSFLKQFYYRFLR